jgi:spore coat protein U-like protein
MRLRRDPPLVAGLAVALYCGVGAHSLTHAQSCNFSVTDVVFGSVDVTMGSAVDTTATVAVDCTSLLPVRVCVNLGAGGGGATDSANRFMKSGADTLRYGLFTDAGRTSPWGSNLWAGGGANSVDIVFGIGGGSTTRTIYGRVYSGQATVPSGSYLSAFSSLDASINYGLLSILLDCGILVTTETTTFNVTADVPSTCRVSANDLDFGTVGTLVSAHDGSTTLAPVCTNGTTYQVGLDGGLSLATDPTQRKMTKGVEFVLYGLYRDAARTQPFGNTIGTDTLPGTGTGLAQSVPVYGRISAQSTPSPGPYSDTVVVTLTY